MTFFKLPSLLFQRRKANSDDLERLFMLPEQQRSSPVSEKIFSVSTQQKKNHFQVTNADVDPDFSGNTKSETLSTGVFNAANDPESPQGVHGGEIVQNLPTRDMYSGSVIPQIPTDKMTESFQLQTSNVSKNDTVSLQKQSRYHPEYVSKEKEEQHAPAADNSQADFKTVKHQSVNTVENRPMRVSPASFEQTTEFFHQNDQEKQPFSRIPDKSLSPVSSDSRNQVNSNHVLQLNSNLNTLTNCAKNQLRYLKKNCELLQNQNYTQPFN